MADGHGGARTPQNPAPVSGPGRLSKRTDGQPGQKLMAPTGQPYGDQKALLQQERTSPMSQSPSVTPADIPAGGATPGPAAPTQPFGAPSARPNEPITHGVNIGPGGGTEVLPQLANPAVQARGPMSSLIQSIAPGNLTGELAALYQAATSRGV